ncbi:MAG TPA: sugar phosphate isomerase/epimerase family protein [Bryobacteraceae bacterium]|jgi:sugar phosphate isomerase/epimerase|nr:sugar phosphate isomerase/epimerase family protein [Bryobacteraceae bacterium]
MKVGIDSYCYHRFFGEVYPQQNAAPSKLSLEAFLDRARALKVDGVSLESCYINPDLHYLRHIRGILDSYGLDRVWAWGHRDGLEGGTSEAALVQMIAHLDCADAIGAKVMRVVGSSRKFRHEPHNAQLDGLTRMFLEAVKPARDHDIKLALENHIDFDSDEILSVIERVGSPFLGVNFDTGNFVRLLDDPIRAMTKLGKYTYATHVKDLKIQRGAPADEWFFFSSTPVGDGIVDNRKLAELLAEAGYTGFLAVEIDFLHPDYSDDEDAAVEKSVTELRKIAADL